MQELELNRDTVNFIIDKAHEFHGREDVTFPAEPLTANLSTARQLMQNHGGDPYYQELKNIIEDLEPDQQISLVSLMWIGRGDYSVDEFGDALGHAADSWNDHTADYLIGTSLLADYLAEGLEQFEAAQDV
ncbi:MAG: DUF3775 domain-containing protein [Gammaproteobacteria bacterium]|nr:DUF3775 domain-containing protein [Gammaproteobacteria bacterium]